MIRLSYSFNTFEEVLEELAEFGYEDSIFDFNHIEEPHEIYKSYDEMVMMILNNAISNIPGINNVSYPNCISISVNAYGFSYMKDNMGLGISTKYNRKTGDVSYTLTFSFNKDKVLLKNNHIYNFAIENGYEMKEVVKSPKK